jgi:hypothetical protein
MIPVLDVLRPIALMAAAVYGATQLRFRRRFDWYIAVSMSYLRPPASTTEWDDVAFPGRRPPRAGTGQRTFCPVGGYAAAQLRNWRAGSSPAELLAVFLTEFLKQNGYHDVGDAVADTVATTAVPALSVSDPDEQAKAAPCADQAAELMPAP